MIEITPQIKIDEADFVLDFILASGPGGQNVNKVASKVRLRFDVNSPSLPEAVRGRLLQLAGNRITQEGYLVIDAGRYRTQEQNRQDALMRLAEWILRAAEQPKPRKKTRPSLASRQKQREAKRRHSLRKQSRRRVEVEQG
jgi:ribosome-associated protein